MTYTWLQDVPINLEIYAEIVAGLGATPPDGLILHVARVLEAGNLEYLDVWDSEAACERFTEQRLHPVVGPVLARHHVRPDREPPRRPAHVAHVWTPAANVWPRPADYSLSAIAGPASCRRTAPAGEQPQPDHAGGRVARQAGPTP